MRPEVEERGRQLGILLRNMAKWKINPISHFDWSGASPVFFSFFLCFNQNLLLSNSACYMLI